MDRKKVLFVFFVTVTILLTLRLGYLQVIKSKETNYKMIEQRYKLIPLYKERGNILDRNGVPFITFNKECIIIIEYEKFIVFKDQVEKINDKIYINLKKNQPVIIRTGVNNAKKLKDIFKEDSELVYIKNPNPDIPNHVIGYVSGYNHKGISGLQLKYNDILDNDTVVNYAVMQNIAGKILNVSESRIVKTGSKYKMQNLVLTMDRHIQRIAEEELRKTGKKGSVVIQDCNTGYILAVCSTPGFEYDYTGNFIKGNEGQLINRATTGYNPGSVFKLVVAAAIIENENALNLDYVCDGSFRLPGHTVKCSYHTYNPGSVDLAEALAFSCNSYFINAAQKLGYKKIYDMSLKLGFTKNTGLDLQNIYEKKGYLPKPELIKSDIDLANVVLGQWVTKATPLQICNLISTIANGGMLNKVNLVQSAVSGNEKILDYVNKEGKRVLSRMTAKRLQEYMKKCVNEGTGKNVDNEIISIGGKTGTAGSGVGENTVWFAGFFPVSNPKYSMVVLLEDSKSGSKDAAPLFSEIAKKIARIYK